MAILKRARARKVLASGKPMPYMRNHGTEGLRFCFSIDDRKDGTHYMIELTHLERDDLIEYWAKAQTEFET